MLIKRLFLNIIITFYFLFFSTSFIVNNKENNNKFNSTVDTVNAFNVEAQRGNPNNYLWPTDASRRVTSSFAEYRSTHFHGGIDISTNRQTGCNVFAPADGYVYRIKITPNGYGKMLFIKHYDGYITTYAHLHTFNEVINSVVREEQYRQKKYAIDLTFDTSRIVVKKGEVIAYTGDTGFGPPHLHFELRDKNLNPINPMLFDSFANNDQIPPRIKRIAILPLEYNSTINGESEPKYYRGFLRKQYFNISQPLRVHGKIGFAIEATDLSDGSWSRTGIHRMELFLDDSLIFSMQLDNVPAEETKLILLHYNLSLIQQGLGKFQKLYVEKGNSLPFYDNRAEESGIINTESLPEGIHRYKIICKDIGDNRTELTGTLFFNRKPKIKIHSVDTDYVNVSCNEKNSIDKYLVFGKLKTNHAWLQHTLTRDRFECDESIAKLPINLQKYDIIKVIAETNLGITSSPIFYVVNNTKKSISDFEIKYDILNDYIRISISTPDIFTSPPTCTFIEGNLKRNVDIEAIEVNKYIGAIVPSDQFTGKHIIQVNAEINGNNHSKQEEFELYSIPTNKSGSFTIENGILKVSYDSGAVFKPLHMKIIRDASKRFPYYSFEPIDVLLKDGITISIAVPRNADTNYGLYLRTNGGWIYQTSEPDSSRKYFSTKLTRTLGEIAILRDDEPPTIDRLKISSPNDKPFINFRYHDNLSGIDFDKLNILIDDQIIIPEIDGEHRRMSYKAENKYDKGKHELKIIIKDKVQNESEINRIFTVK